MWVWCGNSTDGPSPSLFQVNGLSAIRVNIDIWKINDDCFNENIIDKALIENKKRTIRGEVKWSQSSDKNNPTGVD